MNTTMNTTIGSTEVTFVTCDGMKRISANQPLLVKAMQTVTMNQGLVDDNYGVINQAVYIGATASGKLLAFFIDRANRSLGKYQIERAYDDGRPVLDSDSIEWKSLGSESEYEQFMNESGYLAEEFAFGYNSNLPETEQFVGIIGFHC